LVCDHPPRSTQPGHPFVGRHSEYTSQRAVAPCGWGIKAGMVCVRTTSNCFIDKRLIIIRYISSSVYFTLLYSYKLKSSVLLLDASICHH